MNDGDFDPYRKWLGIHLKDQPPNHYRILGLEVFEDDPDVIDAHANKQMAYLHGFATGPHGDLAEQLLNEIAKARLCLLHVDAKQAYDAQLRASLSSGHPRAARKVRSRPQKPVAKKNLDATANRSNSLRIPGGTRQRRPHNKRSSRWPLAAGISLAVVIVSGLLLSVIWQRHGPEPAADDDGQPRRNVVASANPSGGEQGGSEPAADGHQHPHRKVVEVVNSIGMKLKLLPAGTFVMGSDSRKTHQSDKPAHRVTLTKPFYIGVHEVTQEQYEQVMGENPSHRRGPQNPVENVSWEDAVEFCRRLNELPAERESGRIYRLPTEAEWEYACRAGTVTAYSFGDDEPQLGEYAWFRSNSDDMTHVVGQKKPNTWGLYDMHGNVWEWCQDRYDGYPSGAVTDPSGPSSGSLRVNRGGSWRNSAWGCRSSIRDGNVSMLRFNVLGFRLAAVPSSK